MITIHRVEFTSDAIIKAASNGLLPDWIMNNWVSATGENPLEAANAAEKHFKMLKLRILYWRALSFLSLISSSVFLIFIITAGESFSSFVGAILPFSTAWVIISFMSIILSTEKELSRSRADFSAVRGEFGFDFEELLDECDVGLIDLREFSKNEMKAKYNRTLTDAALKLIKLDEAEFIREPHLTRREKFARVQELEKAVGGARLTKLRASLARKFLLGVRFGLASQKIGWNPYFEEARKKIAA